MPRNSPGVNFPPTLHFVIGFALGWLLNRYWPLSILAGRNAFTVVSGWLLIIFGAALVTAAMITFYRHRTGIYPNQPASEIVTSGPYSFTRNPMYAALILIYLGISLLANMLWPLFFLPAVIIILQTTVIKREELYLKEAFGDAYEAYCRKVRRWI